MARPALEVADIFRDHGAAWRAANRGHVSLGQLKVMSAIERCRTAALGGHVAACENEACGLIECCLFADGRVGYLAIEGPDSNPSSVDLATESYRLFSEDARLARAVLASSPTEIAIGQGC